MIKVANNLNNLVKKAAKPDVKDMLDMDSFGGLYADVIGGSIPLADPLALSLNARMQRAGRATAMAEALDMEPGFTVNYPITSTLLSGLGGAALGAGAGAGIGYGLGDEEGASAGGIVGGGAGLLAGFLINAIMRRNKMHEIAKAYDEAKPSKIKPKAHDPYFLDYMGGWHNKGRQKAIAAMLGTEKAPSDYSGLEVAAAPLGLAAGTIGIPGVDIAGIIMNMNARNLREENAKKLKK